MRLLPFDYAVRNLGRSPSRLVLSVGGSMLVVLLLLVAGGFVNGMNRSLRAAGSEHNVILLGAGSEESVERSEIPAATPGIVAASIAGIRAEAGVAYVSAEVHVMLPVRVGAMAPLTQGVGAMNHDAESLRQAMFRGVTPVASLVHPSVSIVEGRWPRAGNDELMIGSMVPTVLNARESEMTIGGTLMIDQRPWKIVGRFRAPGTMVEAEIWLPLADLMTMTKRETISCVILTIDPYNEDTGTGAEFADIDAFTKTRPDLELAAMTERAYFGKLATFFTPIKYVAWITAGLIALGGLCGGLNTMYAAFASRTRELGTLQSLGFRRMAIAISMIQECTVATTTGALVAVAIGVFVLDGLAIRFSMGAFGLLIDERVVIMGLSCGVALGVLGTLPPAIKCLRPPIPVALKAI